MPDLWYYARADGPKSGPLTSRGLKDLADADVIQPTDTVWRDGTPRGVLAAKVKNLFTTVVIVVEPAEGAPAPAVVTTSPAGPDDGTAPVTACPNTAVASAAVAPVATDSDRVPAGAPEGAVVVAMATASATAAPPPRVRPVPPRRARATGGKGVEIVSQDGTNVKFRKRCVACGHHDTCWQNMRIANGVTRVSFFCPKCRKNQGIEIHGSFN